MPKHSPPQHRGTDRVLSAGRRVGRVGSRATRSNLHTVVEETLNDFLARTPFDQPDDHPFEFARFRRSPGALDRFLSSMRNCSFPVTLPNMEDWDEMDVPSQSD
eukprot:4689825-Amphidinium_carterae.1